MKRHHVLVDDPHPQSMAALVLLAGRLQKETIQDWLNFRIAFLNSIISIRGDLVCAHCQAKGLLIETDDTDKLATVDHVVPLSKGGEQFDRTNCIVACYPCNNNRKNRSIEEFRRRLKEGGKSCKHATKDTTGT